MILDRVGLFVVVAILDMSSGLIGRSTKISASFIIFGEFTIALGHGRLNRVGDIEKYNLLLIPK